MWLGERHDANLNCSALVKQQAMKMHAFPAIVSVRTLSMSATVINLMLSPGCFHATKTNVVFFGNLDMLVDTDCNKFMACIWPMGQVCTVPAFVPLLVGCFDLQGID